MSKLRYHLTQSGRFIHEATIAGLQAEQDASITLTPRQRVALKALNRQLTFARAAQIHADNAMLAEDVAPAPTSRHRAVNGGMSFMK